MTYRSVWEILCGDIHRSGQTSVPADARHEGEEDKRINDRLGIRRSVIEKEPNSRVPDQKTDKGVRKQEAGTFCIDESSPKRSTAVDAHWKRRGGRVSVTCCKSQFFLATYRYRRGR